MDRMKTATARKAYENVKGQIGGCGIWCGSCALGNGSLRALIGGLESVLDSHGAEHWAPSEMDYPAFSCGLDVLRGAASCVGCRQGGGRDDCSLRACAVESHVADCSDCTDFGSCANDELLQHMREGARKAGLFVRDPGENAGDLLAVWPKGLEASWPSTILFEDERCSNFPKS